MENIKDIPNLNELIFGIWKQLNKKRKKELFIFSFVAVASAFGEIVSLASILPFLGALTNPDSLFEIKILNSIFSIFGIFESRQILLPITFIFCISVVIAALLRLLNLWLKVRISASIGTDLSCEAYRRTLYQPYSVHIKRNSSKVISVTTTQIKETITGINLILQLGTSILISFSILITLLIINWKIALICGLTFSSIYLLLAKYVQKKLKTNSRIISRGYKGQQKALQEGLAAVRQVLLDGTQSIYTKIYEKEDYPMRQKQAVNNFIASSPRFVLESCGLFLLAIISFGFVKNNNEGLLIIPTIGTMALGAQKLLPALQQIYNSWAGVKGMSSSIYGVLNMLEQEINVQNTYKAIRPFILKSGIKFRNVSFSYGNNSKKYAIKDLNLTINKGQVVGIIGKTGSGKSTFVDLLMGLLKPTKGEILIDEYNLHDEKNYKTLSSWRSSISHVPQEIYLSDSSIEENIAFGENSSQISRIKVKKAAKFAQIESFIKNLPEKYATFVGERGIRMSGGQRQRIAIARAIYKNSKILVLDEATSALDTKTESEVMSAINQISKNLTLIIIAHRESTIINCDRILHFENGRVIKDGTPNEVINEI